MLSCASASANVANSNVANFEEVQPKMKFGVISVVLAATLVACGDSGTGPPPPPPPVTTPPAVSLDLAVGEARTVAGPAELANIEVVGGPELRRYELVLSSGSGVPMSEETVRLQFQTPQSSANIVPAVSQLSQTADRAPPSPLDGVDEAMLARMRGLAYERYIRDRNFEELERVGGSFSSERGYVLATMPKLGDILSLKVGVDQNLLSNCQDETVYLGEVRYVGEHFTLVEDLDFQTLPEGQRFTDDDFQVLGAELDEHTYPVVADYYGEPRDQDSNNTVLAFVTAAVNRLNARDAEGIVAGFFLPRDLVPSSECPASNNGEIFYVLGPDPTAEFGYAVEVGSARSLLRSTVTHEFVHLVNTQQRTPAGSSPRPGIREVAWLDEAMAHLSEELVGFHSAGLEPRRNLDIEGTSQENFRFYNDFHLFNHYRLGRFMRGGCPTAHTNGPASISVLGNSQGHDPGGAESLDFRGFAYGFARWLGDQYGQVGPGGVFSSTNEAELFRDLTTGGPSRTTGIDNVERALRNRGHQVTWPQLVAEFLGSLVADDNAPTTDNRFHWKTWDLRDLYRQLSLSSAGDTCPFTATYPLAPATVTLNASTNQTVSFDVYASSGRFVSIQSDIAAPTFRITVGDGNGDPLPPSMRARLSLIRIR